MKNQNAGNQKGQVLVLFVVVVVVLLGVMMLLVDSGQAYAHRRSAQSAADSAALAGAYQLCNGSSEADALDVAEQYAADFNGADTVNAYMQDGQLVVETAISNPSFLGRFFGTAQINVTAEAKGECIIPGEGTGVMPFAWTCTPPIGDSDSDDCEWTALDYETEYKPLVTGDPVSVYIEGEGDVSTPYDFSTNVMEDYIYIIVDSVKSTDECISNGGTVNCDLNGDGVDEVWPGGDRGWLDLNGKTAPNGANALKGWIAGTYSATIFVHSWVPGESGTVGSAYHELGNREGDIVLVPVFNAICGKTKTPMVPACTSIAHATFPLQTGQTESMVDGGNALYYHIIGFAPFLITCVGTSCPGHDLAHDAGIIPANEKTAEGYFISGYPTDDLSGTGGADFGINIVTLSN